MTDLEKLKDFIMTAQVAAEQGECLMPNITDVLNEIERLQALSLGVVVGQSEQYTCECKVCGKPFDNNEDYYRHYDEKHN